MRLKKLKEEILKEQQREEHRIRDENREIIKLESYAFLIYCSCEF